MDETRDETWTRRLQGRSLADYLEGLAALTGDDAHGPTCRAAAGLVDEGCRACLRRDAVQLVLRDALEERPELADHPLAVRRREALAGVLEAQQGVQRAIEAQAQAVEAERASRVREVDAAEVVRWMREREALTVEIGDLASCSSVWTVPDGLCLASALRPGTWRVVMDDKTAIVVTEDRRVFLGGDEETAAIVVLPTGEVEVRDEARLSEAARAFWTMVRGMREMAPEPPGMVVFAHKKGDSV